MSSYKSKDRLIGPSAEAFERTVNRLLATPPTPRKDMPKKRLGAESRPKGKSWKKRGG